jgi:uncharacterized membrane protein
MTGYAIAANVRAAAHVCRVSVSESDTVTSAAHSCRRMHTDCKNTVTMRANRPRTVGALRECQANPA